MTSKNLQFYFKLKNSAITHNLVLEPYSKRVYNNNIFNVQ